MLYQFYEWNHAALTPFRAVADATRLFYQNPLNPWSHTTTGRSIAAMAELFERTTRIYGKPEFGLHETVVNGRRVPVQDRTVWSKPFCNLLHFKRELPKGRGADPRILVVAPISGHYATLLRGTVEALLPYAEVYITDWVDARHVPVTDGAFDLEDYADYLCEILRFLGPDTHIVGVCQPAVPVMMATARMEEDGDPCAPSTMTLMGGPIDTRENPTAVNALAEERGIEWFRDTVIMPVPFPHKGFMRQVYPGFLQLSGFMSMNLDRHMIAHKDFYLNLVKDDGDSAEKHREFYDEYNAVMDMTAEFYLQTVEEVFIKHSLPKGEMMYRGRPVDLTKITNCGLLTVEGENDDISGVGQTEAAQTLCVNIPDDKRVHYVQPKVGHYGVFNGSRFRAEIAPRMVDFALTHGTTHAGADKPKPAAPTGKGPHRFGAVAERHAKANRLGRDTAKAGESFLAGPAAVSDPAAPARAIETGAAAAMKATTQTTGATAADAKASAPATPKPATQQAKPADTPPPRGKKPAKAGRTTPSSTDAARAEPSSRAASESKQPRPAATKSSRRTARTTASGKPAATKTQTASTTAKPAASAKEGGKPAPSTAPVASEPSKKPSSDTNRATPAAPTAANANGPRSAASQSQTASAPKDEATTATTAKPKSEASSHASGDTPTVTRKPAETNRPSTVKPSSPQAGPASASPPKRAPDPATASSTTTPAKATEAEGPASGKTSKPADEATAASSASRSMEAKSDGTNQNATKRQTARKGSSRSRSTSRQGGRRP